MCRACLPVTLGHAAPGQNKCPHQCKIAACSPDFFILFKLMTESSTHSVNGKLTQKILKFVITENTVSNYIEIRKKKLSAFFAQPRKNRYRKRAILSPYSYKEVRHLWWTELTILFFPAFLISTTNYHFGQKTMPLFSHYRLEFFFCLITIQTLFTSLTHRNINNLPADLANHKLHQDTQ